LGSGLESRKETVRWKEGRVVQQPVAVALAPTSAAKAVEVAPALRVIHAVPPKHGGGGFERGAVQRGMQREADAGNTERGRAEQRGPMRGECAERQGCCRGRAKRAAWRFGPGGGRGGGGRLVRGGGREARDGPGAVGWSPVGTPMLRGN
jgi:hypothetical protein